MQALPTGLSKTAKTVYAQNFLGIDHFLPEKQGLEWIERYQGYVEAMKKGGEGFPVPLSRVTLPPSESFNFEKVNDLMNDDRTIGFRVHFGMDENYVIRILISGVDQEGKSLYIVKRKSAKNTMTAMGNTPPKDTTGFSETGSLP